MEEFLSDIRIQESMALIFISFGLALVIVGFMLKKLKFFDSKKTVRWRKVSPSAVTGHACMIAGGVIAFAAILMFILVRIED